MHPFFTIKCYNPWTLGCLWSRRAGGVEARLKTKCWEGIAALSPIPKIWSQKSHESSNSPHIAHGGGRMANWAEAQPGNMIPVRLGLTAPGAFWAAEAGGGEGCLHSLCLQHRTKCLEVLQPLCHHERENYLLRLVEQEGWKIWVLNDAIWLPTNSALFSFCLMLLSGFCDDGVLLINCTSFWNIKILGYCSRVTQEVYFCRLQETLGSFFRFPHDCSHINLRIQSILTFYLPKRAS